MAGIGRIEKKLESNNQATNKDISVAFQDLGQLMSRAKQMTQLSKSIASKLKNHDPVTNDETIQFRSHLLELGVDQLDIEDSNVEDRLPERIARIVTHVMDLKHQDQITLSDVYCCYNRAQGGFDLLSPHDVISACKQIDDQSNLGLRLVKYKSGLLVMQKRSSDDKFILEQTVQCVVDAESLSPLQLSSRTNTSIQLARQRLEEAEDAGKLCRDESIEGLRFYPNNFSQRPQ